MTIVWSLHSTPMISSAKEGSSRCCSEGARTGRWPAAAGREGKDHSPLDQIRDTLVLSSDLLHQAMRRHTHPIDGLSDYLLMGLIMNLLKDASGLEIQAIQRPAAFFLPRASEP